MSVHSASDSSRREHWSGSDEIDLSRYLNVLRQRWLEIVLITFAVVVLTAAGVLAYRQVTPPVYEANATAAIIRTSTDVRFDDRFTTSSEPNLDVNSRRAALVALVDSGSIAQQVINELGDQLPPDMQRPARLLEVVTGEMATAAGRVGQSDLIGIRVRAKSPDLAAAIANTWATAYVQQVNSVYGQVPDDMLGSVEAQLVDATGTYDAAQANLETHLASSELDALTRQSVVLSDTLGILQKGKTDALNVYVESLVRSYGGIVQSYVTAQADAQVLAFDKEQEGERARLSAYFDALNAAEVETFTNQSNRLRAELRMYNDQWLRTSSLLAAARTLQVQVTTDAADADAAALALQVLNLQIVNSAQQTTPLLASSSLTANLQTLLQPVTPLQIQLDAGSMVGGSSTRASITDVRQGVDAMVTSLESLLDTLEQNIARLSGSLLSGESFADLNSAVPVESPLAQAILDGYPALFESGVFSATALQPDSNALLLMGQEQAARFLALAENGTLPTADSPDAPMTATIAQLEEQLRSLRGQIEVERARTQQFTQERNLAWESVEALSNKQAELQLARAAANSEVRLSSLAVPIDEPVPQVSLLLSLVLAAMAGLLLGILVAIARELMAVRPVHLPVNSATGSQ